MGSKSGSGVLKMKFENDKYNNWVFPEDKETYNLLIDAKPTSILFPVNNPNGIFVDFKSEPDKWKQFYEAMKKGYEMVYE